MINSADELPKVDNDGNPLEAPSIDFDSYTLIIGRASFGDTAWIIAEQNAVKGSKKITMYIHVERPRGMSYGLAIPSTISFWGLYPKLPNLPITVKRK
jgi:hypothetical protein